MKTNEPDFSRQWTYLCDNCNGFWQSTVLFDIFPLFPLRCPKCGFDWETTSIVAEYGGDDPRAWREYKTVSVRSSFELWAIEQYRRAHSTEV